MKKIDGYDIIGDVHGHATELKGLLNSLGYKEDENGCFSHASKSRMAIFLGDVIDKGDEQFETIDIVKKMQESGNAKFVLGNHEMDLLLYYTNDAKTGTYYGKSNEKIATKTACFRDAFKGRLKERAEVLKWLEKQPLFLKNEGKDVFSFSEASSFTLPNNTDSIELKPNDTKGFNAIHASWNTQALKQLDKFLEKDNHVSKSFWKNAIKENSPEKQLLQSILEGETIDVGKKEARVNWLDNDSSSSLADKALITDKKKRKVEDKNIDTYTYSKDEPFVFFGHYSKDEKPHGKNGICIDGAIAKEKKLIAYSVNKGDKQINPNQFTIVDSCKSINLVLQNKMMKVATVR
jgi:hypothetical protein